MENSQGYRDGRGYISITQGIQVQLHFHETREWGLAKRSIFTKLRRRKKALREWEDNEGGGPWELL